MIFEGKTLRVTIPADDPAWQIPENVRRERVLSEAGARIKFADEYDTLCREELANVTQPANEMSKTAKDLSQQARAIQGQIINLKREAERLETEGRVLEAEAKKLRDQNMYLGRKGFLERELSKTADWEIEEKD